MVPLMERAPPKREDNEDSSMCAFMCALLTDGRTSKSALLVVQRADEAKNANIEKKKRRRPSVSAGRVLAVIRLLLFKPDNASEQQAGPIRRPRTHRKGGRQNTLEIDHMGHAHARRRKERWKIPLLSLYLSHSVWHFVLRPFHCSDA